MNEELEVEIRNGLELFEAFGRDLQRFTCEHPDKWINPRLIPWTAADEDHHCEALEALENGKSGYYSKKSGEEDRESSEIPAGFEHLYAPGGAMAHCLRKG
jgi:hypothetical protein